MIRQQQQQQLRRKQQHNNNKNDYQTNKRIQPPQIKLERINSEENGDHDNNNKKGQVDETLAKKLQLEQKIRGNDTKQISRYDIDKTSH